MSDDEQAASAASSSASPQRRPSRPTRNLPPAPINIDAAVQLRLNGDAVNNDCPAAAPVVASPVTEDNFQAEADKEATRLTPLRAHYLKKTLIALQFGRELDGISTTSPVPNVSTLSYLGAPFTPPPRDAPAPALDLPFLRYIFRQFVLTFPFLAAAPKNFFPEKLQPFIASVLARNLSAASPMDDAGEDAEQASRKKLLAKLEKQLSLVLGSATKLAEPEEVVRLTQADLNRLEAIAKKRHARLLKNKEVFEVNIVCIRAVVDKGRVRSKVHEVSAA